jgi:hypothetical protein
MVLLGILQYMFVNRSRKGPFKCGVVLSNIKVFRPLMTLNVNPCLVARLVYSFNVYRNGLAENIFIYSSHLSGSDSPIIFMCITNIMVTIHVKNLIKKFLESLFKINTFLIIFSLLKRSFRDHEKNRYFTKYQRTFIPSFQPIFFPSE